MMTGWRSRQAARAREAQAKATEAKNLDTLRMSVFKHGRSERNAADREAFQAHLVRAARARRGLPAPPASRNRRPRRVWRIRSVF